METAAEFFKKRVGKTTCAGLMKFSKNARKVLPDPMRSVSARFDFCLGAKSGRPLNFEAGDVFALLMRLASKVRQPLVSVVVGLAGASYDRARISSRNRRRIWSTEPRGGFCSK